MLNYTNVKELAKKYDYFLFDCDAVIYHGENIHIGNSLRWIEWLEKQGKKVFFITNSAVNSRKMMGAKLGNQVFQYKNVKEDHLYPACAIAAQYVKQSMPDCKKVRYIGMKYMGEELRSQGFETVGGDDWEGHEGEKYFSYEDMENYKPDPEIKAVITGFDQMVTYTKLCLASLQI